jgi:phage recombination protein Bet
MSAKVGSAVMVEEGEFKVEFVPFGERDPIVLTPSLVNSYLTVKTKSGRSASPADVRMFLERCAAQALNPWLGDAYLIGYDLDDGGAQFSLITSHQALLKRAEGSSQYDGMASGVITAPTAMIRGETPWPANPELAIQRREGDLLYPWETVIGGWAVVHRKDRTHPSSDAVEFDVFNSKKARWLKDPAGMIVKVAEGSALRKAFPSTLSGLIFQEEMDAVREGRGKHRESEDDGRTRISDLGVPKKLTEELSTVLDTSMPDDRRAVVPTKDRPNVHEDAPVERKAAVSPVEAEILPDEVSDVLRRAGAARTATALLMVKSGWLKIRDKYPEHAEMVDGKLARRAEMVAAPGEKV